MGTDEGVSVGRVPHHQDLHHHIAGDGEIRAAFALVPWQRLLCDFDEAKNGNG